MWHSSQVKLHYGKNCAKCGASISSFIGSSQFEQPKAQLLALNMPGAPINWNWQSQQPLPQARQTPRRGRDKTGTTRFPPKIRRLSDRDNPALCQLVPARALNANPKIWPDLRTLVTQLERNHVGFARHAQC
jgi:hypothetical protein